MAVALATSETWHRFAATVFTMKVRVEVWLEWSNLALVGLCVANPVLPRWRGFETCVSARGTIERELFALLRPWRLFRVVRWALLAHAQRVVAGKFGSGWSRWRRCRRRPWWQRVVCAEHLFFAMGAVCGPRRLDRLLDAGDACLRVLLFHFACLREVVLTGCLRRLERWCREAE